jgi:hypothetical protein
MLRKKDLHDKAILLRKRGFSYNEIRAVVSAGHGTIWRWCYRIELTQEQRERLRDKKRNTPLIKNLIERSKKDKEDSLIWADRKIKDLKTNKDDDLLIIGAMLYWAEGYNSDKNHSAIFTNTDAEMIKIMIRFFREIIGVSDNKMKVMVRLDKRGDIEKAKEYWANATNLSLERFQKPELLEMNEKSQSLSRHPNGICRLSVYDVSARRKIDNLINLLKQKMSPRSSEDRAVHS